MEVQGLGPPVDMNPSVKYILDKIAIRPYEGGFMEGLGKEAIEIICKAISRLLRHGSKRAKEPGNSYVVEETSTTGQLLYSAMKGSPSSRRSYSAMSPSNDMPTVKGYTPIRPDGMDEVISEIKEKQSFIINGLTQGNLQRHNDDVDAINHSKLEGKSNTRVSNMTEALSPYSEGSNPSARQSVRFDMRTATERRSLPDTSPSNPVNASTAVPRTPLRSSLRSSSLGAIQKQWSQESVAPTQSLRQRKYPIQEDVPSATPASFDDNEEAMLGMSSAHDVAAQQVKNGELDQFFHLKYATENITTDPSAAVARTISNQTLEDVSYGHGSEPSFREMNSPEVTPNFEHVKDKDFQQELIDDMFETVSIFDDNSSIAESDNSSVPATNPLITETFNMERLIRNKRAGKPSFSTRSRNSDTSTMYSDIIIKETNML